jgi:ribose transport system ATP-binding protein
MIYPKLGLKKQPLFTPEREYRKGTESVFKKLSVVAPGIDAKINTLSGGNQQKIVVGKWLPFDINVLLLADPAKGVDVSAKCDLYQFVSEMVKEKNMGVILYASDNEELIDYCDRLLIMYEGKIVDELTGSEITDKNITEKSVKAGSREE